MRHLIVASLIVAASSTASAEPVEPPEPGVAPVALAGEALPETRVQPIAVLEGHVWAIPRLLEGLGDDDPVVRARCCFLLGQIGDHSVLDALAERLDDSDRDVREFAGMALMRMGDGRGYHATVAAMQGNRWWVRFWAVDAVGRNLWSTSFAPMLRAPDELVRKLATEAQERTWSPVEAQVAYAGPAEASIDEVIHYFVNYLIGETDWWWHAGDYPQILRGLETAVWLDPSYVEGFSNAAYLYWSLGRNTEAIATYRKNVHLNPDDCDAQWELGFYYFNAQKRYEDAIPLLRRAWELGCRPEDAHVLAHALEHSGRTREALELWREFARTEPDSGVVRLNIERLEALLGDG